MMLGMIKIKNTHSKSTFCDVKLKLWDKIVGIKYSNLISISNLWESKNIHLSSKSQTFCFIIID